jgi:hypothetical protein
LETPAVTGRDAVFTRDVIAAGSRSLAEGVRTWHCLCFRPIGGAAWASRTSGGPPESAMLMMRNKYCSNCLKTQRFLDLGSYLVCERCSKRLERIAGATSHPGAPVEPRVVSWMERTAEIRREAM